MAVCLLRRSRTYTPVLINMHLLMFLSLLSISKQIGTWKIVEISTPVLINAHLFLAIFHDQCEHSLLTIIILTNMFIGKFRIKLQFCFCGQRLQLSGRAHAS